jgi:hypothetical protein
MKVKARDIIPGWPKPRSASCWSYNVYWLPWFPSLDERLADEQATRAYHKEQQRMVTAWLERWRHPPMDEQMRIFSGKLNYRYFITSLENFGNNILNSG